MIKYYMQITKPKIIFGNIISTMSGFFIASQKNINYTLLILLLIAMLAIIASSCVFNNLIDKDIDKNMKRTANRALVIGYITPKNSFIYAIILSVLGFSILIKIVNTLTIILTILGFFIYVVTYSVYLKRKSYYSTLVGSISGSMPPVIGYCAISNQFDVIALILWIIFGVWQIPHFYAIAMLYLIEYKNASIPVFPIQNSIKLTKHHINFCIIIFIISTYLLCLIKNTNSVILFIIELINSYWLYISLQGYRYVNAENVIWAKKMFLLSIFIIINFNIMILVNSII